jgi:uncharacterized protein (DUF2236 family)
MHTADHELSPEAEAEIEEIVNQMLANDRENERLRHQIESIVDSDAPA